MGYVLAIELSYTLQLGVVALGVLVVCSYAMSVVEGHGYGVCVLSMPGTIL